MTSHFLQHWKREQCYQHDVYHDEGASSLQSANNLKNLQLERIHYYPLFPTIWWNVFSAEIFANIWLLPLPVKMSWLTLFVPSPHFATYHFLLLFSFKYFGVGNGFQAWIVFILICSLGLSNGNKRRKLSSTKLACVAGAGFLGRKKKSNRRLLRRLLQNINS